MSVLRVGPCAVCRMEGPTLDTDDWTCPSCLVRRTVAIARVRAPWWRRLLAWWRVRRIERRALSLSEYVEVRVPPFAGGGVVQVPLVPPPLPIYSDGPREPVTPATPKPVPTRIPGPGQPMMK